MEDEDKQLEELNAIDILEVIRKAKAYDELMAAPEYDSNSNWQDWWEMLDDIKAHSTKHKSQVMNCDQPMQLKIGFICEETGRMWHIRLSKIKNAINCEQKSKNRTQTREELFQKAISNQNGRYALAAALSYNEGVEVEKEK